MARSLQTGVERRYPNRELINALAARHMQELILAARRGTDPEDIETEQVAELEALRAEMPVRDWNAFHKVYLEERQNASNAMRDGMEEVANRRESVRVRMLVIGGLFLFGLFHTMIWAMNGGHVELARDWGLIEPAPTPEADSPALEVARMQARATLAKSPIPSLPPVPALLPPSAVATLTSAPGGVLALSGLWQPLPLDALTDAAPFDQLSRRVHLIQMATSAPGSATDGLAGAPDLSLPVTLSSPPSPDAASGVFSGEGNALSLRSAGPAANGVEAPAPFAGAGTVYSMRPAMPPAPSPPGLFAGPGIVTTLRQTGNAPAPLAIALPLLPVQPPPPALALDWQAPPTAPDISDGAAVRPLPAPVLTLAPGPASLPAAPTAPLDPPPAPALIRPEALSAPVPLAPASLFAGPGSLMVLRAVAAEQQPPASGPSTPATLFSGSGETLSLVPSTAPDLPDIPLPQPPP